MPFIPDRFLLPLPAPRPGADVGLLDAPPVDEHLGEKPAVAVVTVSSQSDLAASYQCLQPALCGAAAGLVQLRGVDVDQPHLLAIAHQAVAVERDAALRRRARGCRGERKAGDQLPNLMYFTISFCTSAG